MVNPKNIVDVTTAIPVDMEESTEFEDMAKQWKSMMIGITNKMELARYRIIEMIKVTSDKYGTVNGTDHILQMANDRNMNLNYISCNNIARQLQEDLIELAKQNKTNDIVDIKDIVMKKFFNNDFIFEHVNQYVEELADMEIVQQVCGACDDALDFCTKAAEECDKILKDMEELDLEAYAVWSEEDNAEQVSIRNEIEEIIKKTQEDIEKLLND